MNRAVTNHEQLQSAAQRLQLLQQLVPEVTAAEVHAAVVTQFDPEHQAYVLSLPEKDQLTVPQRETLLALVREALAVPVEPWQVVARPDSLLEQEPQPGSIIERSRFAPLAVTHVRFANNVRFHYHFNDFKKEHVTVSLTLAGGKIRETAANRGITQVASLALKYPATSRFSSTEIRNFMTGKKVAVSGRDSEDALTIEISGAPEALEDGFQLAHLLLQDARIEPASVALWKAQQLQELEANRSRLHVRVREAAELALSGRDIRQALLTPEQVNTLAGRLPEAQTWLDTILRSAPMEVAIVGDLPEARALQLVAKYLGSLPTRPRHDPSLTPLRQVAGFTGPLTETVEVETITPRAHLLLMWRCADWQDVQGRRIMQQATRVLERRMRQEIREERGLTYSTGVYARSNKVYPLMSALFVEFTTAPEKMDDAIQAARSVVETLAVNGPTAEEVATVQKQLQNSLETTLKEPGFWVGLLADLEYHHTRLVDVEDLIDKLLALSQADIAAEIKQTVVAERFTMIVGRPKAPTASEKSQLPPPTSGGVTR
jgi:zinc protease